MEKKEQGLGLHARRIIAYIVLILIAAFCLIWFFVLFINATRSDGELARGFSPIPSTHLLENWNNMMTKSITDFGRGMLNSLLVSTCSAVLCVYFSTMTAYALHAYDFKLKKFFFTFILAVMTIPTQISALGFIQTVNFLNLKDSYLPLILPVIASPVTFFYIKQYMQSNLPSSLIEAARIDGSGEFHTFNRIAIPLMKPAIAVQAIFSFVSTWNNYFVPALILESNKKKTLPIMIFMLRSQDPSHLDFGQVYMSIAFSIFPVVLVYLFLSRFIVQGVTVGSVKG